MQLVICFVKRKSTTKFSETAIFSNERFGFSALPRCRNFNQLFGHNPNPPLDTGNPCLPCCTAKPVKRRITVTTTIAAKQLDIFNREIQFVTARVDQMQAIMIATRTVDNGQPIITADPMFGMHNQITRFKRADFTQKIITTATFRLRTQQPLAKDIRFGKHQNVISLKPSFQWPLRDIHASMFYFSQCRDRLHNANTDLMFQ